MNRAYGLLTVKSVDDEKRTIEGIATSPTPDRMGDIVEPKGAVYKLPIPLLWQHDQTQPVGEVYAAKTSNDGITVKTRIFKASESETLKKRFDEAWESVKLGLVKGFSIGFRPIEHSQIDNTFSSRFKSWEWLELSLVTVPANADATIQVIRGLCVPVGSPVSLRPGTLERAKGGRKNAVYLR